MIIGLMGKAQAGKDSVGTRLMETHGFHRIAFADALKEMALDIDPLIDTNTHLSQAVQEMGMDETKVKYPEARRFLQRLGTEGIRRHVSDTFWVDVVKRKLNYYPDVVITDVRFPNEYNLIARHYGKIILVQRDTESMASGNHASENSLEGYAYDAIIENNGDLDHLRMTVDSTMKELRTV